MPLWMSQLPLQSKRQNRIDLRLTMKPSLAAILTTGLTPESAIAATASCIAPSAPVAVQSSCRTSPLQTPTPLVTYLPSMLPCSVSTQIQSNPHLATILLRLEPGSICHAPNERPVLDLSAFCNRFAACIMSSALEAVRLIVGWALHYGPGMQTRRYLLSWGMPTL